MKNHIQVLMTAILVLALATVAVAADPIVGTWKLNAAKSKFSADFLAIQKEAAPKESTLVVRDLDVDQIEISETGFRTDGSAILQKGTQPKQGGTVSGFSEGISFIHTVVNQNERIGTILQNGKQVEVIRWVVSKDGKTLSSTRRRVDTKGNPMEHLAVYDKQ